MSLSPIQDLRHIFISGGTSRAWPSDPIKRYNWLLRTLTENGFDIRELNNYSACFNFESMEFRLVNNADNILLIVSVPRDESSSTWLSNRQSGFTQAEALTSRINMIVDNFFPSQAVVGKGTISSVDALFTHNKKK